MECEEGLDRLSDSGDDGKYVDFFNDLKSFEDDQREVQPNDILSQEP